MDIGANCLALQNLQIPKHSTNRTLPKKIFPRRFPDKRRLIFSRPDAILVVPRKRVPMTISWYPLISREGRGGNREQSAPAPAPSASKVRHPSQLLPQQRQIHLVEVKYCEHTRPKNQLEASKCGLGHPQPPNLGLDTHTAIKLALKLHAHSVQCAYKLASTRSDLKKTPFSSYCQEQARVERKRKGKRPRKLGPAACIKGRFPN
eukprot:1146730-Pelagomonas_calceolata.AAC.5